jgi:hypothetical protein
VEKLDVSRKLPGPAVMVDEDEFREAAGAFGYSAEFREACYEAARAAVREAVRLAGDIGLQGGRMDLLGGGGSEATPAATGRGQTSEVEKKTSEVKELARPGARRAEYSPPSRRLSGVADRLRVGEIRPRMRACALGPATARTA